MNTKEFSERFDTLLQNYSPQYYIKDTHNLLQIDEYEKSVFLTKAQNEIINQLLPLYERNEDIRRKLAVLVKTASFASPTSTGGIADNSLQFKVPTDTLAVVFEKVKINSPQACFNGKELSVLPITHDEFFLQKDNPFRKPRITNVDSSAWRLDNGENTESLELILPQDTTLNTYTIRYLRVPKPIILVNLPENSIEGINTTSECELNSFLLQEQILELGVRLALSAISKTTQNE